jgi:hypothetical protein
MACCHGADWRRLNVAAILYARQLIYFAGCGLFAEY